MKANRVYKYKDYLSGINTQKQVNKKVTLLQTSIIDFRIIQWIVLLK